MRSIVVPLSLTLVLGPPAVAQTTIGSSGGSQVRTWGPTNSPIYGQTITTPTENVLESFSFWFGHTSPLSSTPTPSIQYNAYVYAWNSALNRATGSALFASALSTYTATSSSPYTKTTWNTGGLHLTPGSVYTLFVKASGGVGGVDMESKSTDGYSGGGFVYRNDQNPTGGSWAGPGWVTAADLRFEAQFTAVPVPSTWLLLVTGLLGLAFVARHRRREADGAA